MPIDIGLIDIGPSPSPHRPIYARRSAAITRIASLRLPASEHCGHANNGMAGLPAGSNRSWAARCESSRR